MKGLFALVVFAMTLAVAQPASVTWGGAYVQGSLLTTVAPLKLGVWFTPTTAVPAAGTVTITASTAILTTARRANAAVLCYSDNVAQTCTAAQTTTKLTVTLAAGKSLTAGKPAYIEMQDQVPVNPGAATVTFTIETSTDTDALAGQTGYTIYANANAQKLLRSPTVAYGTHSVSSLKNGAARGDIIFTFTPTIATAATNTIAFTSAAGTIFTANADDTTTTVCAVKQFDPKTATMKAVTVTKTVTTLNRVATVTMGAALYPNLPVSVICDGSKNIAVLGTDEANAWTMVSTTDTQAGTAVTLTSDSGVTWASAARTTLTTGAAGGDLVVKFTPTTALAQNDFITITASEEIFAAAAAITGVTVTAGSPTAALALIEDTNTKTVETAANTILGTAAMKNQIILKVNAAATATHEITVTVPSAKMAANGATAQAVTFSIGTTKDPGNLVGQTGYTLTAPASSSSAASANSTTASAAAATGTETTVTQVYTFADLTVAAYTGDMKSNCECAYANTVEDATTPTWCVATTSAYTYKSGVAMSSSAAARRAAKVTFVLKVKSSVKTTSQLQTMVASGSTATKFAAALAAVNTASNKTVAPGTATVATATFTGGSSSASTLLPSMLSLVAAIFVAARQ